MNTDGSLVRLDGIHKWFGTLHVLKGIDLSIDPQEVLVIIGPSGSGKSTLLRTINLLEEPTEGQVFFDGVELTDIRTDLNEARTHMGMVFQAFNLFPHLTSSGPGASWTTSGSPTRRRPSPPSCRAASSSGWRSPGPSPWSPR